MCITSNSNSYSSASYNRTQSDNSHSDAFRGHAETEKQTTETRYSQQYSRSPYGASMSTSMTTIKQFTEKSGANPSYGFAGKQCWNESRHAVQHRNHESDRFGNSKNHRFNSEFKNHDSNHFGGHQSNFGSAHVKPQENHFNRPNNGCFHSQFNSQSQWAGSQNNCNTAHVKPGENHFNRPNNDCFHSQFNNHSQFARNESDRSFTQIKTVQNHFASQNNNCFHSQSNNHSQFARNESNRSFTQINVQNHFVSQTTDRGHSQSHHAESQFSGQRNEWTKTQVQNNQASIDLGDYALSLNKSDSSISLKNEKTGDTTKIWGDPHITTNGTTGMFNGSMTFNLPDQTKITVGTQAKGAVSYSDQVTITNGNHAYVVNGLSQLNSNPLTVESARNGHQLDQQTPDGFSLVANKSGTGWINPLTGRAPTAADFNKA